MLTTIRDKLKTWVVVLLIVLVAIPLIFLGVGEYGTNQERYAFRVNEQEVSKSIVLQEIGQFKDVLRKNYQGSIPPVYTNKFIKKITIDNLIRRNIENNISSNANLVFSDESIIDDIQNTSSFKDENGFNTQLYKRRLFMINMNPAVYEQYVYQKGIRDQMRKAITDTSLLSVYDKKINVAANYHQKSGRLVEIKKNLIEDQINITLNQINDYYQKNRESFLSDDEAEFEYIRLNKSDFIKLTKIEENELINTYEKNLSSGIYKLDDQYELNHLVFPIEGNKDATLKSAKKAYEKLTKGTTFLEITQEFEIDDDSKNNKGYLGKLSLGEMPDIIKNNIIGMNNEDLKMITTEPNAIHIIKLMELHKRGNKTFNMVKGNIKNKLLTNKGSIDYFATLDNIKNNLFIKNTSLYNVAKSFNLKLVKTPRISESYKNNILSSNVLKQLFNNINNDAPYNPIYIGNDDVLFVKKIKYYPSKQLPLKDTEDAIKALLYTKAINSKLSKIAQETLKSLNNGTYSNFQSFKVYNYDDQYDKEIMTIINQQPVTNSFVSHKLSSGHYLLLKLDSFDQVLDNEKINNDNFYDFLDNTNSEGDYNSFYVSKYDEFEIDVNEEYLDQ
ncbi:MAG: SurA N-terminal domain-containing protein [Gammaproteobacteria bacterium]|nr:SurA N-terminal domain-containing protein [Gammaproteobacteria bacterium]MBL6819058.1 SurA N-terminal domain-containing protein [Gammaproteobacteria bacterium]MBL6899260.1 SurA N-terminal domain-containing protein [Gammaproteobacteria bacterium]